LDEYRAFLSGDAREIRYLAQLMGVTISRFFRDADVYEHLRQIWPGWSARQRVLMFSAGCAGGEEPYSLAILWHAWGPPGVKAVILALDIDSASLARAKAGLYPPGSLREVAPTIRRRYFRPQGRFWRLDDEIMNMVDFYRGDLQEIGPPLHLDLVMCRNMAYTYFSNAARMWTTKALARALNPGGWLVVGAKERIHCEEAFKAVYPCIYQRTDS